mmetsp:Transcript_23162/g.60560  ORF Transcript_23162/g.60560 Transcript_23162/m.60560 type:complete len:640 (-) Transcript_23162:67-1986(-)
MMATKSPWAQGPPAVAKPLSLADVMRDQEDQRDWDKSEQLARNLERDEIARVADVEPSEALAAAEATETVAGKPAVATAGDDEETSDFELALALQRQFNEEHDSYINEAETRINQRHGQNSRIRLSLDRFRAQYPEESTNVALSSRPSAIGADDVLSDDDELFEEDQPLSYHKETKTMRDADGNIVTKHNADRASKRNKQRMTDDLPLSFPCGDMRKLDGKGPRGKDGRVPTHVYNRLQSFANKTEKQRIRVTEKKDKSTSDLAIDTKTRLILFRMINGQILDSVNGAVSTGKEAVVFHAARHVDPDDPSSAIQEVALKIFKTTLTEFKQRQQFLHGDRRFESRVGRQSARKLVKLWAEKESANLVRMARAGVPCPEMVLQHKHVLILGFIGQDGVAAPKLKDAHFSSQASRKAALDQVREAVVTMYKTCQLVHCDLSEYNMLYHKKKVYMIDVGQAVETSHPRAKEFLYRDCVNVCRFFTKVGEPTTPTPQKLYEEVSGEAIADDEAAQYKESINTSRQAPKQKLAGTETYLLGLCDLSENADPGPVFADPFASTAKAKAAIVAGDDEAAAAAPAGDAESTESESEEVAEKAIEGILAEVAAAAAAADPSTPPAAAAVDSPDAAPTVVAATSPVAPAE